MPKRFEMRLPDNAEEMIKQIRERYGLKSDAQAVIYALNEISRNLRNITPDYTDEEINERLNTIKRPLHSKAEMPGTIDRLREESTKQYIAARADRARPVNAIRLCPTCDKPMPGRICYRCAPAKELIQVDDPQ